MDNKRDINIDALKGFAIILVVIGHSIQFIYSKNNFDNNIIFRYIYSFHMPLFMFVSGYLAYKSDRKIDFEWLEKRFKFLIIPFLFWIIIKLFFNNFDTSYVAQVFLKPDKGYWFLLVLFYNCFILYIVNFFSKKIQPFIYLIVIILINSIPINIFGLVFLKWYIVFFAIGYFFSVYKDYLFKYIKLIFVFSFIFFNFLVFFWYRLYEPSLYTYLTSITGLLLYFSLFYIVDCKNVKKFLAKIGLYTIQIYILHYFLLDIINTQIILLDTTIFIILGVLIPILIAKLIEKNEIINKILFGK